MTKFLKTFSVLVFIFFSSIQIGLSQKPQKIQKRLNDLKKTEKKQLSEEEKVVAASKKRHLEIQTKDVRKRLKKNSKKSQTGTMYKKRISFKRLYNILFTNKKR